MRRSLMVATIGFSRLLLAAGDPGDGQFFETRIRPLLVEHCQECHGAKKQKGGLRLDSREAAVAGGDSGPAIVVGEPQKSLLIESVGYKNEDLQMPPKKRLSAAQTADLAEWVKRGAVWPGADPGVVVKRGGEMRFSEEMKRHWAFQPLGKSAPPLSRPGSNPIDAFLSEKLATVGLKFAPPADKRTLLRRVTFDLIGLPPSPAEMESFLADESPNAYEAVIDRLLGSPHYGEQWARHWLDVARYSDSNGSEVDHAMANAWRYRDYVVQAFNQDRPFSRFIEEQLAGDLLLKPTAETIAATGFLMLGPKSLAELDKPKLIADVVDEQVDTVSRAFLGLTMGCARCHDHKFDPLPTADYYALAGIFRSCQTLEVSRRVATWTERPIGGAADRERIEKLGARIAAFKQEKGGGQKVLPKLERGAPWLLVEAERFQRGNLRVDRDDFGKEVGVVRTRMDYPDRVEYDLEIAAGGDYQLEIRYAAKEARTFQITLNGNLVEMEAGGEITGDWKATAQRWFLQGAYPFKTGRNTLVFHCDGPMPLFDKWLVGRVLDDHAMHSATLPATLTKPLVENPNRNKQIDGEIAAAEDELAKIPSALSPLEDKIGDAPILIRGNPAAPAAIVPRGFPRIIEAIDVPRPGSKQSGRLELAHWIAHPLNPLTPRVIVNRVWLWHFGQGIVRSPDNFGLRGEAPSHPELLDFLATELMENGWSLKHLHRLICTSSAYQQSTSNPAAESDSANRLYSRFPQRRLSAEELRDAMLLVSDQLDQTMGGSLMSVLNRTYASGGNAPPNVATKMGYEQPRRSLYLPIIRSALHDLFAVFDYPDPGMLTGQRAQTTVAPQALFLMNSPFVQAQSSAFARRLQRLNPDETARLNAAYEIAYSRLPNADELAAGLAFLDHEEVAQRESGQTSPRQLAWDRLCHALLASNDLLYLR